MTNALTLDYGKCPCGGQYECRVVEVRMTVDGRKMILTGVPQGACPSCGGRVYKLNVLQSIEVLMRSSDSTR